MAGRRSRPQPKQAAGQRQPPHRDERGRGAGAGNGQPQAPGGSSGSVPWHATQQQAWMAVVPAKSPPESRRNCFLVRTGLTSLCRASTFLYNKAHLMCVRYRILDDDVGRHATRFIAWPSCRLRFFEADRRNQLSRVRVLSHGRLTPIEQATHWDPLVPEGPDRVRAATRLAADAERKGMHDLAMLVRRQYGLQPPSSGQGV